MKKIVGFFTEMWQSNSQSNSQSQILTANQELTEATPEAKNLKIEIKIKSIQFNTANCNLDKAITKPQINFDLAILSKNEPNKNGIEDIINKKPKHTGSIDLNCQPCDGSVIVSKYHDRQPLETRDASWVRQSLFTVQKLRTQAQIITQTNLAVQLETTSYNDVEFIF